MLIKVRVSPSVVVSKIIMAISNCCSAFAATASLILALFGAQIKYGNVSFAVLGSVNGWDPNSKAQVCFNAALGYGIVALLMALRGIYVARQRTNEGHRRHTSHPADTSPLLSTVRL